ncbi:hypothetical protein Tco_1264791 [Tanacetum coccineum]
MDDPNITMEEYIRLKEEKARKPGKVFNWETAKYGKIRYDEDIHDLRSVETKFPAIAFNDEVSSETLSCEPMVSSLNNEIEFRISFDDSDDEDYTVIFEKNSFSYKIISTNDLKMDSENDNEKVMPSLPSHEPTISCLDDLDFFKDFENEFPAIIWLFHHVIRGTSTLGISSARDFLGTAPSYIAIRDSILRLCHRLIACSIAGRSQAPEKVLTIIALALLFINMAKLVRLQICEQLDDTWAWVAMGPERQPDVVAGAPRVAQDAPIIHEGGQADPTPIQAPPPPAATAKTMPQRMARLEDDVHEIRGTLAEQRETLREYQRRRVRQRTGEANTSTA